ncbi:MAG TPA: hypothetical protein VFS19_01910 [Planctomycetota bacterium]|nr:hypothetical protein [Planctomycetota bacterium]
MKLLALLAAILLPPQEKNEAEALFKKMEEKLAKATSITAKVKGSIEQKMLTLEVEAEIHLAEGNRARGAFTLTSDAQTLTSGVVSDGKTTHVTPTQGPAQTFATLDKLGPLLAGTYGRGGVVTTIGMLNNSRVGPADLDSKAPVKDFKMGAKEKVGDRDTQAVEFKLTLGKEADIEVTVWIDLATHLPVKRTMKSTKNTIQETTVDVKLDEKIDPAKFELPKPAK